MAYGTKYRLAYDVLESPSRDLATYVLTFELDGYSGSVIQLTRGGASPVVAKIKNSQDSIIGIREKNLSIEILADLDLSELQRAKPKQWKVTHSKIIGSNTTVDFKGWLVPTNSGTEYVDGKKYIRLEANDGLEFLKNTDFVDDAGKYYEGLTSIFEIARLCLSKTGLGLNINTINNTYAVGNAQNDSDDALKQRYIDIDLYRGESEPFVTYKVLEQILLSEKCRISQEDGEWWFENTTEKRTGFVKARKYQASGTFISGGTLNLRVAALHNSNLQPMGGGEISSVPANKWVKATHKLGKFKNRLLNKDFENIFVGDFISWFKTHPDLSVSRVGGGTSTNSYGPKLSGYASRPKNSAFLYQNIVLGTNSTPALTDAVAALINRNIIFSGSAYTEDIESAFVRCTVEIITIDSGIGYFGLNDSGEWVSTSADILLKNTDINGYSKKTPVSWDITSKKLSEITFYNRATGKMIDWQNRLSQISIKVYLGQGIKQIAPPAGETQNSYVSYNHVSLSWINADTNRNLRDINYKASQSGYAPNNESFEVAYGDYVDSSNLSALKYADGSLTKLWTSDSDNSPKNFHSLGVVDVLDETGGSPKVYDGTIWGLLKFRHSVELAGFTNRGYIVGYSYDYASSMADVRIIEHQDTTGMSVKKTGVLSDGTEIDMPDDSPPSPVMGNGVGGGSTGGTGGLTATGWLQQVLSGIQGYTVDEEPVNVVWGNVVEDDAFDFGAIVRRSDKLLIGKDDDNLELGKSDSLTTILGRLGIRNTNNFLGEFSVAGLTANRVATLPDRNIEINKWSDFSGVPTTFTPSVHTHQIADVVNLVDALAGKQPLNGNLTSIGLLNSNGIVRRSGINTFVIGTNDPITLSGDVTGTGTTSIAVTLKNVATAGDYKSVVVNAKGLVTGGTLKATPSYLSDYGFQEDFATQSETFWNSKIDDFIEFGSDIQINGGLGIIGNVFLGGNFFDKDSSAGTANQVLMPVSGGGVAWTSLSTTQISNFSANVLGQVLTGLGTGSNTPITSSNTILTGFETLQAQISAKANGFSGTTNYLPKFTSSTGLGNSSIYENGTNIGIGTTTADRKLVINGQIGFSYSDGSSYVGLSSTSDNLGIQFFAGVTSSESNNNYRFSNHAGQNIFVIQNGGSVGIKTDSPLASLHVKGNEDRVAIFQSRATSGSNYLEFLSSGGGSQGYIGFARTINDFIFYNPNATNYEFYNGGALSFIINGDSTAKFIKSVQFDEIATCSVSPTAANHLVNKAFVESLSFIKKGDNVKTISFTTLTKSGLYAVNGYTLTAGDLVLDAGGTSGGGVWVAASGSWSRSTTNDTDAEIRGAYHLVTAGDYINQRYINNNTSAITLDTTPITYTLDFGQEADPVWNAYKTANDLTPTRFGNWNTAFGWGNHSGLYVDKVSTQSDIGGAKKFTTSIQSPIIRAGSDSLGITLSNISGTAPRVSSDFTLDFAATTKFDWFTSGNIGRMRLTTTGLRVGSTTDPSYRLHISGTTGFEGLISLGNTSQNISMSSGSVGQFIRRSLVSNGFYDVDVNNWANIFVADISDIATYYQAKITATENYLTKKTATNFGDSQIFDNGTFLAIGGTTAIDGSKFSVIGKLGASTARIGDNTDGINIGSLAINSTGALGYGATSHVWNVSSTEKMSLNGSRLALAGNLELAGKLKLNGSFGNDHYFVKSLGVDGSGNPLGTEWAIMNCGEISDIADLYFSKAEADTSFIRRVTDEGERGFYMYDDAANTVKEGFIFTNSVTGTMGIHGYRLEGSTVQQYGFQLAKDGLPYWLFPDGARKRILTEADVVGGGGGGTTYTLADPLYFAGNQINIKTASATQAGVLSSIKYAEFDAKLADGATINNKLNFAPLKHLYFGYISNSVYDARIYHNPPDLSWHFQSETSDIRLSTYGTAKDISMVSADGNISFVGKKYFFTKGLPSAPVNIEIDMSGFATGKVLKATSSTKAEWVTP